MPNLLNNLQLEELSLVDRPANAQAMVSLFKRDNSMSEVDKGKKPKDKREDYDDEQGKVPGEQDTGPDEYKKMKSENERMRKFLIENGFSITAETIEKKEPLEQIDVNGEMVNKADIPAPVLKALEAAQVEKQEAALRKRASEELPNFDEKVAMSLLKGDLDEDTLKALKAADAAFADLMKEEGETNTADLTEPQAKMDRLVDEYAQSNKVSKYVAYDAVAKTAEGKALIKELYKKD